MNDELINWSRREFDDLPWRSKRTLYGTLVSEIMLQQTTVATVLKHYKDFLKRFPDLQYLAEATEEEVCSQWQGLGYYRRARNLRKAALYLVENCGGCFPKSLEKLKNIPGVGDYTARALLAIGMNQEALAVDANIERVMARLYLLEEEKGLKLQRYLQGSYKGLNIPFKKYSYREINEALMDLGRVYCQAKRADCHLCPLRRKCGVFKSKKDPLNYPRQNAIRKKDKHELELLRVVVHHRGKILAYVKSQKEWLSGQLEVPTFILSTTDKSLMQYPVFEGDVREVRERCSKVVKTAITKYKIKNQILRVTKAEFQSILRTFGDDRSYKYYTLNSQDNHFSTTTHKCLDELSREVNL